MQPIGPRFRTIVAVESERIVFSACKRSLSPDAISTSSSVPTIRSQSARTVFRCAETRSEAM
ncbi:hypothetical protein D3C80_1958510 [compost metagenome]